MVTSGTGVPVLIKVCVIWLKISFQILYNFVLEEEVRRADDAPEAVKDEAEGGGEPTCVLR